MNVQIEELMTISVDIPTGLMIDPGRGDRVTVCCNVHALMEAAVFFRQLADKIQTVSEQCPAVIWQTS